MVEDVYVEMIKRLGHELEKRSNDTAENWIYGTYCDVVYDFNNCANKNIIAQKSEN